MRNYTLLLLLVLLALFATQSAAAASPSAIACDDYVVDQAGVLKGTMSAQAEEAANSLQNLGADPRVVFIDTFKPAGSIDDFEQALTKRCDSWQSADAGLRKNNLVALIVAMKDRKAVLSWGERWDPSLEGEADRIRADFLNPYLADGEFGNAVERTFSEVGDLLDAQLHPKAGPTNIYEAPDEPTDLTPLWIILAALGGLGLLALSAFGGLRYRRFLARREAAQEQAVKASEAAVNALGDMSSAHDELTRAVEIARLPLGEAEAAELDSSYEEATTAVGAASNAWGDLHGVEADPAKRHRLDEYEALTKRFLTIEAEAKAAGMKIAAANALAAELGRLANELPRRAEAVQTAIAASATVQKEASDAGYKVAVAVAKVKQADKLAAQAGKAIAGKRLRAAEQALAAAEQLTAAADAWCQGLPELKSTLERDAAALDQRADAVEVRIKEVQAVFATMSKTYAEDSWEAVRGNGSEAEAALKYSREAHTEAVRTGAMDCQEWEASRAALTSGNEALDQADTVLAAIVELSASLQAAEVASPGEIEAAATDIASAWDYVRQYDADVPEALEVELKQAEDALAEAKRELQEAKPNYLEVVRYARQANETADRVLVDARASHEQIERLHAKAETSIREAERAVATAESYISSHSSDVESGAKSQLATAKKTLAKAQQTEVTVRSEDTADTDQIEGLEDKIALAEAAESKADAAYAQAERDYREAEAERERARQRQQAALSTSSSFSGGGGGGGFSSGGFGGGGGGSSSGGW